MAGQRSEVRRSARSRALFARAEQSGRPKNLNSRLRLETLEDRAMLALDPLFGTAGIVVTPVQPGNNDYANAMTIAPASTPPGSLPAGSIILAGNSQLSTTNSSNFNVSIAVFTPSGVPLNTFGNGGKVTLPIGLSKNMVNGVGVQQSTGNIIVTGYAFVHFGDLSVARSTDPNFIDPLTGIALFGITSSARPFARRDIGQTINVANTTANVTNGWTPGDYIITDIDANGIAFLGNPPNATPIIGNTIPTLTAEWSMDNFDLMIASIRPNGALEPGFGTNGNGFTLVPVGSSDDFGFNLFVQPDNKIVVAGYTNRGTSGTPVYNFVVARFTAAGVLDTTFGSGNGFVSTPVGSGSAFANALVEAGPWIYVVGSAVGTGGKTGIAIAQYSVTTGAPNTSFGNGLNYTITPAPSGVAPTYANAVAVNPANGELLVAASQFTSQTTPAIFLLAEFNPTDGSLDTTFGGNDTGFTSVSSTNARNLANSIAIASNGKILVGGSSFANNKYSLLLARFHPDGRVDNTFGSQGTFVTPVGTGDSVAPKNFATANGSTVAVIPGAGTTPDRIILAGQSVGPAINSVAQGFDFTVAAYVGDLVSTPAAFQNAAEPLDVSGDGNITPLDALSVINDLNSKGARLLTRAVGSGGNAGPPYVDVNGDGYATPQDALMVINHLNIAASSASSKAVVAQLNSTDSVSPDAQPASAPVAASTNDAVATGAGPGLPDPAAASPAAVRSAVLSRSGSAALTDLEEVLGVLADSRVRSQLAGP